MKIRQISFRGYTVYSLAHPIELPEGWAVVDGVGVPREIASQVGVPRDGFDPFFAPTMRFHYPSVMIENSIEEAEPQYIGGCQQLSEVKPEFGGGFGYQLPEQMIARKISIFHDKRGIHFSGCDLEKNELDK